MEKLSRIKKCACFKGLDTLDFNALLRCLQIRVKRCKPGEIIEYEGSTPRYAYIILNGRARTASFDDNGVALIQNDFTQDMIYGLEYAFSNSLYKEEFFTVEETTLVICDLKKIMSPCENRCPRHYKVMNECFKQIGVNLNETKSRIKELVQNKTKDKVLTYLKRACPKVERFYTIPYNRQEMADFLGVERTALSAELSKLQKEGYIEFNKSSFKRKLRQ